MSLAIPVQKLHQLQNIRWRIGVALACVALWLVIRASGLPLMPCGLLIPLLTISTVTDLFAKMRIPNWLTYSTCWLAFLAALTVSLTRGIANAGDTASLFATTATTPVTISDSLAGFAATFGMMLVLHFICGIGSGDVKLAGAIGACVGFRPGLNVVMWAFVVSGLMSAGFIALNTDPRWWIRKVLWRLFPAYIMEPTADQSEILHHKLALAPYLSIGTCLTLFWMPLI